VGDLAAAIVGLAESEAGGTFHLVNDGVASRADWARDVVSRLAIPVAVEDITLDEFVRPSRPPRWGVLQPSVVAGVAMRHWKAAMDERVQLGGFDV
jgi:dTDP-4-dehydrorhamnose reductase